MYQQGGTISNALKSIESNDYVLPAIQREFVWRPEQICSLFDSVMQGYPFGEFLFWRIERENCGNYRWYGFVRDYHQRDNPHCPDLGIMHDKALAAILDGQQRLTAFNIGLRGSMALKRPYKRWSSPDAFPRLVLALDLLALPDPYEADEGGNRNYYTFEFVTENRIGMDGARLWFKVPDILSMEMGPDMLKRLLPYNLGDSQLETAFRALSRLWNAVRSDPTIVYFEEKEQDIDRVLNIFIRRNSGGTVLSYSDLLLSIAVSQWEELDARKEVHQLVDELNQIGNKFNLSKDFVLKAGLMLTDIANVGFRVENFTHANMLALEKNWDKIRNALIAAVQLIASFGFNSATIRAQSALLPIAYYFYKSELPTNFATIDRYAPERKAIQDWFTRSILKASGIWGSGLDVLLTALREVIRNTDNGQFPTAELRRVMAQRGKSLEFSQEEIEDLADMGYGDNRLFALLTLLFPFIDLKNRFHIDHVFPESRFTQTRLTQAGVSDEQIGAFQDCAKRLGNLQLLDGDINIEKRAKLPNEWLDERFEKNDQARQHYCEQHLFGDIPKEIKKFMGFYEKRCQRLQERIGELINFA